MEVYNEELRHHGVKGMHWGERRYQNEDGTLTEEGKRRYSESLSNVYDKDSDDDYTVSKGTSVFRRTSSDKETNDNNPYTYTYDYDNTKDNNFYSQFGSKVTQYTVNDDIRLAGKRTLGKAFVDKMLQLEDEEDIEAMDTLYYDQTKRTGEKYIEDLFSVPYNPSKYIETLERNGADIVGRMLATQRNDKKDEKMKRRGMRDSDTAANDLGRSIVEKLLNDGYSGMRDYNDYGSGAGVTTPTIVFDPSERLKVLDSWID